MEDVLIAGIDNAGAARTDEYTYSYDSSVGAGGKGDVYLDFQYKVVRPLVARLYPRIQDTGRWAMGGSSLGGLLSCYAGWTRPQYFSSVFCVSFVVDVVDTRWYPL